MEKLISSFTAADVIIEKEVVLSQSYLTLKQFHLRHRLFNGGWSKLITREMITRCNSVAVLLYQAHTDKVVLINQFRVGALLHTSPWLIEIVAGAVESNEHQVETVARREIKEETGLPVEKLIPIVNYWTTPGGASERCYVFCGVLNANLALPQRKLAGLAEEGEDILVSAIPRETAYQSVQQGLIVQGAAIIALQWLQLNYEKIELYK